MSKPIDAVEIPIFPLGTVLFPGGVLPLKLFEARYLDMAARSKPLDALAHRARRVSLASRGQGAHHRNQNLGRRCVPCSGRTSRRFPHP